MADLKFQQLTENTAPASTDILPTVDDPAGTPLDRKVTVGNLSKGLDPALIPNTPSGDIAATNVQAAIDELESEKSPLAGSASIATVGTVSTGVWEGTDVGVAHGGTGASTAQAAIDTLTAVAGATDEHVLTKDTATGNAVFKAAGGGGGGGGPRAFTYVIAASDSRDGTGADATCDGTADNVEIQAGIDACVAANGGTVMLLDGTFTVAAAINIKTGVKLLGQGFGTKVTRAATNISILTASQTTTDIDASYINFDGSSTSSTYLIDFSSNAVSYANIHHNHLNNCGGGIKTDYVQYSNINDNFIEPQQDYGIKGGTYDNNFYSNKIIQSGTSTSVYGIYLNTIVSNNGNINVFGNQVKLYANGSSSGYCIGLTVSAGGTGYSINVENNITYGGGYGIYSSANGSVIISGNKTWRSAKEGIYVSNNSSSKLSINGNFIEEASYSNNTTYNSLTVIAIGANSIVGINNNCMEAVTGAVVNYHISFRGSTTCYVNINNNTMDTFYNTNTIFLDSNTERVQLLGNTPVNALFSREMRYMKNTDGDAMAAGDLVVLKAVAAGDEVTHTTTGGDDLVFGMAVEAIANGSYGYIQLSGKTAALKVDGTTDIAIGDYISTFTTAGIGKKASAGDTAIAIALEAYTTDDSNGVIDALIVSPRKVGTVV